MDRREPRLCDKAMEGILDLLGRGYSWEFVTRRYQLESETVARRLVREYKKRKARE